MAIIVMYNNFCINGTIITHASPELFHSSGHCSDSEGLVSISLVLNEGLIREIFQITTFQNLTQSTERLIFD